MNLKDFTASQQQALLDLTVLAMYADGHLALKEDERVRRVINAMGFKTETECNHQYDASISRVSQHSQTATAARDHATILAASFSNAQQRKEVSEILGDIMASDNNVSAKESSFLQLVRTVLTA